MSLFTELGRAVARGLLPLDHAEAALVCASAKVTKPDDDLSEVIRIDRHILGLHVHKHVIKRQAASGAIATVLRPLIDTKQPSKRLFAEAHNTNEDHDFALTEQEVDDIVAVEMSWAVKKVERHAK